MKLAELAILWACLFLLLASGGCGSSDPSVELPAASPVAAIDSAAVASTQAAAGNAEAIASVKKSAVDLAGSAAETSRQASAIKLEAPAVAPRADTILVEAAKVQRVGTDLEKTAVKMEGTQARIVGVGVDLARAKEQDKIEAAQFKALLEKQAEETETQKGRADRAEASFKAGADKQLLIVRGFCIGLLIVCIILFVAESKLRLWWIGGACGAVGGIIFTAIFGEFLWIVEIGLIAIVAGGIAWGIYALFIRKKAVEIKQGQVEELAQTVQDTKAVLGSVAPDKEAALFAAGGAIDTLQLKSTQAEVKRLKAEGKVATRKIAAIPAVVPQTPGVP